MNEQLYRRCRHVTPNGRQLWKSRPGIPHPIDGSMSNICYGYAPVDGVLMTEAEWREQVGATAPSLDMGDDNEWVMLDLGPWDRLERGNP